MQDKLIERAIREAGLDDGHPVSPLQALHERERQRADATADDIAASCVVRGAHGGAR